MTTTTDTIKALRDALTEIQRCTDSPAIRAIAKKAGALTADASDQAPDATPSELEHARLAAEHYGRPASDIPAIVAFERHRNKQKRIIGMAGLNALPCYVAGFNTGRAARPAPVRKGDGND